MDCNPIARRRCDAVERHVPTHRRVRAMIHGQQALMGDPILVVTPTFHPEQVGTPHYVTDLVLEWERQGRSISVITAQPYYPAFRRFPGYGRKRRFDRISNIPIYRVPTIVPRAGRPLWRLVNEFNLLLQIIVGRLVGRVSASRHVIAVSPGVPLAVLAASLLRRRHSQFVVIVHDIAFGLAQTTAGRLGRGVGDMLRRLEVAVLNRADHITVLSDAMGRALVRAGVKVPVVTVPLWPTIQVDDGITLSDVPTVLYSGNLGRKQGVERLLDVAEALSRNVEGARLVIRGEGSARENLEAQVYRRHLSNVTFLPFVEAEDLARTLAAAHVHVVPQQPEGAAFAVPSKVINILAAGRPVVVTAERGSPMADLAVTVPAVRCADPADPADFAAKVVELLLDDQLREGLASAARDWMQQANTRARAAQYYAALVGAASEAFE